MEIKLVTIEPGLLYFRCRGALGHSLATDSPDPHAGDRQTSVAGRPLGHSLATDSPDPLRTLLSNQSWEGSVLLDLRDIDAVGTESIGWLVHWHRWVTKTGGVLALCCIPSRFSDFFRLCHLERLIPIYEDETAAREGLNSFGIAEALPGKAEPGIGRSVAAKPAPEDGVIPLLKPVPPMVPAGNEEPAGVRPGSPPARVVEVLVVDDSSVERRRAGDALEKRSADRPPPGGGIHVLYAGNGREALTVIEQKRPNLVVTDLVMPGMDGLGLVKEVRATYPSLPVVLMTAHGSEEIAAAALRAGAASYVPKKYLARDLAETVETILRLAQADREQLIFPHLIASEYRFLLPNNLDLVPPLVDFLQGHLERKRICHEMGALHVAIALREALVNAVTHGNLEAPGALREHDYAGYLRCVSERQGQSPYKDRHVHVTAHETPQDIVYTIRDEGPGFDTATLPDPTCSDNFKKATGRGLYLIRTFMDEVKFNDAGNEITLIKRGVRDRPNAQ
jgi:CheY-like chemotaxis protein/anti-sigma regulatory factor (Ser/Thr protein kinase)/anti-anti-sigma regulatory factor